jgi:histidinol-phosphate aminotransferase
MFENKFIKKLIPYVTTSQAPWHLSKGVSCAKLDWNEGTDVPDFLVNRAKELILDTRIYNWYPDVECLKITQALALKLGVNFSKVLFYPGSDTALEDICRAFLDADDSVAQLVPTYGNFKVFVESCGGQCLDFNMLEFSLVNFNKFCNKIRKWSPKIIYLVSPNNPCGYSIPETVLKTALKEFSNCLFVVDQAYVEFNDLADMTRLTNNFPNLIVTRTFSKAYGLAGFRLGYIVANSDIVSSLKKIRNGKNISAFAQALGLEYLKHSKELSSWVDEVKNNRLRVSASLDKIGWRYLQSDANFITFFPDNVEGFLRDCVSERVFIRNLSHVMSGALRVTIGGYKHTDLFLKVLVKDT